MKQDAKLLNILRSSVEEYADGDGWAPLGTCGSLIKRQYPDFDPRNYGFRTFTQLFEGTGLFEVIRRNTGSTQTVFVKDGKK